MDSGQPPVQQSDLSLGKSSRRFSVTGPAIGVALFLATCAAYYPASRLGFIGLDDPYYVFANKHVLGGFTPSGVKWAFVSFDPDNWFPLTRLSHMLDYALFGTNAGFHHDVNILIHALAVLMLYIFLARATRQRWPSAFVAAIFALHPLHVESVAWIAERKDVLCAFFWFAALWAWVRYAERPSKIRYLLALALFAAGLMSKPMIVTLPLLLPILDIWPLRRPFSWKGLMPQLPFWALSGAATVLTILAQKNAGFVRSLDSFPMGTRAMNALDTVFIYIGKTFWPTGLAAEYGWPAHQSVWLATLAGISLAGISLVFLKVRCQRPYLAAGWFWFLVTLLPVIGLVQVGPQARADRYMYVPMVGLLIMIAWGGKDILDHAIPENPGSRRAVAAPVCAIAVTVLCVYFATRDWTQEQYWESMPVLFRHAVAEDGRNYLAWEYLGTSADRDTELDARIECYRIAADIRPDFPELHADFGKALLQANRVPESIAQFETALRISPGNTKSRCLLGTALLKAQRFDEAVSQFGLAVRNDPGSAMARDDLAVGLWRRHRGDSEADQNASRAEIRKQLGQAIALRPDDPLAFTNFGFILLDWGLPANAAEANSYFVQALSVAPDDLAAHIGLSKTLGVPPLSNPAAAADHLAIAQKLEPDPERRQRFELPLLDTNQPRDMR